MLVHVKIEDDKKVLECEDLAVILTELVDYTRRRLYSARTAAKEKSMWARILRDSVAELARLKRGENVSDDDLATLFSKVPKKVLLIVEQKTGLKLGWLVGKRSKRFDYREGRRCVGKRAKEA